MATRLLSKSHTATWALLVIAIPLIYLLTLPWVKYVVIRPQSMDKGSVWISTRPWPPWLDAYCVPYHWLMEQTSAGRMLWDYQEWCFKLVQ